MYTDKVMEIWQEMLGLDEINPDENFFNLGGNSLTGIMIVEEVKEKFGYEFSIVEIQKYDTVNKMAEQLEIELKGE